MVIITGANNGLGLEIVKILVEKNIDVLAISKHSNNIKKIKNIMYIKGDLSHTTTIKKVIDVINKKKYKIDLLINNVGYSTLENEKDILKEINAIFSVNLFSIVNLTERLIKNSQVTFNIINVLSHTAYKGNQNIYYCTSKWALRGYTECLKIKYGKLGYKISNFIPCSMKTSYWLNKPI
nr:SDR family oxidoreductase [Acholeplasmatales bacterium]